MIKTETVKKVKTFDANNKENGFLIELFKDGDKTAVYLTAAKPGAFKGYHLHRVRAARYVCIRGRMKIITYQNKKRQEFVLDAQKPGRLFIPNNVATGLENIGDEEAWLINYPEPPYNPNLKDEQVEYTEAELEAGVVK
ncbi:WxcM-like domain-containing protein [Patescibacteria group bacterium]|nr:WxcM-like domain-containing protein [Patescibacteria group bacterium]